MRNLTKRQSQMFFRRFSSGFWEARASSDSTSIYRILHEEDDDDFTSTQKNLISGSACACERGLREGIREANKE